MGNKSGKHETEESKPISGQKERKGGLSPSIELESRLAKRGATALADKAGVVKPLKIGNSLSNDCDSSGHSIGNGAKRRSKNTGSMNGKINSSSNDNAHGFVESSFEAIPVRQPSGGSAISTLDSASSGGNFAQDSLEALNFDVVESGHRDEHETSAGGENLPPHNALFPSPKPALQPREYSWSDPCIASKADSSSIGLCDSINGQEAGFDSSQCTKGSTISSTRTSPYPSFSFGGTGALVMSGQQVTPSSQSNSLTKIKACSATPGCVLDLDDELLMENILNDCAVR